MIQILAAAVILTFESRCLEKASICGCRVQRDQDKLQAAKQDVEQCRFFTYISSHCIHLQVTIVFTHVNTA